MTNDIQGVLPIIFGGIALAFLAAHIYSYFYNKKEEREFQAQSEEKRKRRGVRDSGDRIRW